MVGPTASRKHRMSNQNPRGVTIVYSALAMAYDEYVVIQKITVYRAQEGKSRLYKPPPWLSWKYRSCLTGHVYIAETACLSQFSSESGPSGNGSPGSALHKKKIFGPSQGWMECSTGAEQESELEIPGQDPSWSGTALIGGKATDSHTLSHKRVEIDHVVPDWTVDGFYHVI